MKKVEAESLGAVHTILLENNRIDSRKITENKNGNKWIHKHLGELINPELFYRNAIYRVTGSRSATYEVNKNGTYIFIIRDLGGNETEINVEVNEL